MPFVTVPTNSGSVDFHYEISTPTNHSASEIDPSLPTIFFIHAAYTSHEIFELQFSSPQLRQFNLVTVEMRGYGETRGRIGEVAYTPRESADDVWNVMEALGLPCLHVFAISIGTSIALELASRHPQRILSMTLCSPLSPKEDEAIMNGRLEVHEIWKMAHTFKGEGPTEVLLDMDESCVHDVLIGAAQLSFNNHSNKTIDSIVALAISRAKRLWAGSRENIQEAYKSVVGWHLDRQPVSDEQLLQITCPVSIIHFQQDIAYSVKFAHDLATKLKSADVAPVYNIKGTHIGNVTNAAKVNTILRQTVTSAEYKSNQRSFPDVLANAQPLRTPFTDLLAPYTPNSDDEDDCLRDLVY